MNKPIIILGGGPTGLATAYKLAEIGKPFILIEKEKYLGGLSATLKHKNHLYEFGPHAFHLKDPKIIAFVKNLLKNEYRIIPTKTEVLIEGNLLEYPLKASELIRKINPIMGGKIMGGYIFAYIKKILHRREPRNFQEWGLNNFGKTLYKMSFGDYTQKVWGINPSQLSARLAKDKLSRLNLGDIIVKLFGLKGMTQPVYFKKYLYPKQGASRIFELMTKEIEKKGQICLQTEVVKINCQENNITSVTIIDEKGKKKILDCQNVVSTLTLRDLVPMFNNCVRKDVIAGAKELKYRNLIIVYVVTDNLSLTNSQWIYLVENKFIFNRVTCGKNLSPAFSPEGKNVLAFEICCQKGDKIWQKSDIELVELVKKDLHKLWGEVKISSNFVAKISNAYPIYLVGFEKNLDQVLAGLKNINNLISTGRNGLFLNSDIHDCFKMGFEVAEKIAKVQ